MAVKLAAKEARREARKPLAKTGRQEWLVPQEKTEQVASAMALLESISFGDPFPVKAAEMGTLAAAAAAVAAAAVQIILR